LFDNFMKEWKLIQVKEINRFNGWLEAQIADACISLDKCADGSHTMDILEDRIIQLRRMKDALPKYLLSYTNYPDAGEKGKTDE
jgi:hypothetical protein